MVGGGSFQRHIMTSGGTIAQTVITVQPDSDLTLSAIAAANTARTQNAVTEALIELSRIFKVYWQALEGAVPECTPKLQHTPTRTLALSSASSSASDLTERASSFASPPGAARGNYYREQPMRKG
jgi:hypothetical protein